MSVKRHLVALCVAALAFSAPGSALGGGKAIEAKVLKRGTARPEGTHNIGVYVRTRSDYRATWEGWGFRSDRPPVNFEHKRVLFAATTESGSCPLRLRRVTLNRDKDRLVVHLSNGVADGEPCTDDLRDRSFVVKVDRAPLPRGELDVRIRRH